MGQSVTHAKVNDWLVPALLGACVGVLAWMAITLYDISGTLRVSVYRIEEHERRLSNLETLYFKP